MKKRIIVSILTVIMLMTMLQTAALAADEDGTEAVASTTPQAAIYLDQQHGADSNDGLTKESAVQSIVKANELAESNHTNDIYLTSSYKITGAEVWDLGGKTIHRYGLGVYMIELVNASASLTLSNVVIDGAEYTVEATHAAETYSIIKAANGGTIVLKSGAVLQNNKAAQFGSGILANNGVNITMEDGAIIRNNTNRNYELGGGILIGNGSTFTMNGGEISGNTANGGGGVAIIGSSMVMNSGTISNNSTYRTSGQGSYGAGVYVADYANATNASGGNTLFTPAPASFEMNGGSISDNTALDYGGGILTFPQQGQQITININNGNISGNQVTEGSGGAVAAFFGVTELNVKGGTLSGNSAQNYGGGVFLYDATNVTISGGTISENKASQGGGVYLWPTSAVKQTNGSIENNVANVGGGVCGGTYTMTGGVIKDNNNSLTNEARLSARGDGVYVGTAFNLGNDAVISTNNDVYLVKGSSTPKEGRYINVISPYTGASTAKPIQIHSEDTTIEEANIIGTQLVHYTADADGETAATKADADSIFIPSWKMPEGLVIGQSKETGKTDWMTYVPAVKIQYQWVSTDNPTDVTPPADDHIRNGTAYTAKAQQDTHQGYVFDGWYTDEQCTLPYADGTVLDADTTLYGKWTVARGSLNVSKTVTGNAGDTSKAFNFTVTLGNTEINGVFGEMTFVDGVATFVLKHGESKTATGLPSGITYSVTEAEANQDGYTTVSSKASGSIMKNDTVMVGFTNTKNSNISEGPDHPDVPSKPGVPQLNKEDHFAYVIGYPDGGFKPESNVTRAEMSAIFARLLKEKIYLNENYSTFYSDVDANGWYAEYIGLLTELRIINGYPDGTFRPNNSVTRAEFATVASRFISNKKSVGGFRDVRNEYWARESIEFAKAEGWLNGYPDGTFKPEQNITRAEVVNIVNKMLDRNADKKYVDENVGGLYNYNDLSISHWAYYPIMEASNGHDYVRLPNKGEDWLNHRRP